MIYARSFDADLERRRKRAASLADVDRRRQRSQALQGSGLRERLAVAEVAADAIPATLRQRAALTFAVCARQLRLREPTTLRWFSGREIRITAGAHLAAHAEVWLSDTLSPDQVAFCVAHEARHVWQAEQFDGNDWRLAANSAARQWCERDADDFAHKFCNPAAAR